MNLERYKKQILVDVLGKKGQQIISKKNIVIIGGGGLGSNSANLMVRAGIGSVIIIDNDLLDISNLHRTSLFNERDIGKSKCQILEEKLRLVNSNVEVKGINKRISKDNIGLFIKEADIILDGTDNMESRFLINEASIKYNIPWIYAGVHTTTGMVMGVIPNKTPCLKCISQNFSDRLLDEIPVLGNLPITIASIQCIEALKILLEKKLSGLIIYDTWKQNFEKLHIKRNPECICCCKKHFEFL